MHEKIEDIIFKAKNKIGISLQYCVNSLSHLNIQNLKDTLFFNENESSNLLARDVMLIYAQHGKSELVYQIIETLKIPVTSQLIIELLNNFHDYTADNVISLHNLSFSPYIENENIPILIENQIRNKIIPQMSLLEIVQLKNKGFTCFNNATTQQEYFLLDTNIHQVQLSEKTAYDSFIIDIEE